MSVSMLVMSGVCLGSSVLWDAVSFQAVRKFACMKREVKTGESGPCIGAIRRAVHGTQHNM